MPRWRRSPSLRPWTAPGAHRAPRARGRHAARRAAEARRGLSSLAPRAARAAAPLTSMAPRTILYTGKGGVGKTSVAAATARRLAAGGKRDADRLDRSGAFARRRPRRRARARAAAGRRAPARAAGRRPGGDGTALGVGPGLARRPAGAPRRRPHLGRGADRPAGARRAVQPAGDTPPSRRGRLRRDRRRLRADRRDAAAAVVPRRRALVAREGLSAAQPDGRGRAAVRARAARRAGARATCSGCCAT